MQAEQNQRTSDNSEPSVGVDEVSGHDVDSSSTESADAQTESVPSLDLIFGILKNGRRRRVLKYLRDVDGEVTLSDLAEHIAAIENDTTEAQLTSSERKRVYVGLYQCHLPKMDDAGAIDYNQSRGLIRRTDKAEYFDEYLDEESEAQDRQWYKYYAAVSTFGVAPAALALGLSLPEPITAVLLLTTLVAIGGLSLYHRRVAESE
jgi:DNA-binding transcriptional ArsR family regulator